MHDPNPIRKRTAQCQLPVALLETPGHLATARATSYLLEQLKRWFVSLVLAQQSSADPELAVAATRLALPRYHPRWYDYGNVFRKVRRQ